MPGPASPPRQEGHPGSVQAGLDQARGRVAVRGGAQRRIPGARHERHRAVHGPGLRLRGSPRRVGRLGSGDPGLPSVSGPAAGRVARHGAIRRRVPDGRRNPRGARPRNSSMAERLHVRRGRPAAPRARRGEPQEAAGGRGFCVLPDDLGRGLRHDEDDPGDARAEDPEGRLHAPSGGVRPGLQAHPAEVPPAAAGDRHLHGHGAADVADGARICRPAAGAGYPGGALRVPARYAGGGGPEVPRLLGQRGGDAGAGGTARRVGDLVRRDHGRPAGAARALGAPGSRRTRRLARRRCNAGVRRAGRVGCQVLRQAGLPAAPGRTDGGGGDGRLRPHHRVGGVFLRRLLRGAAGQAVARPPDDLRGRQPQRSQLDPEPTSEKQDGEAPLSAPWLLGDPMWVPAACPVYQYEAQRHQRHDLPRIGGRGPPPDAGDGLHQGGHPAGVGGAAGCWVCPPGARDRDRGPRGLAGRGPAARQA